VSIELLSSKHIEEIIPEVQYRGIIRDMRQALREEQFTCSIYPGFCYPKFPPVDTDEIIQALRGKRFTYEIHSSCPGDTEIWITDIGLSGGYKGSMVLETRYWWLGMAALIPNYSKVMGYDGLPPPIIGISIEKEIDSIPIQPFISAKDLLLNNRYRLTEVIIKRKYPAWMTKMATSGLSKGEDYTDIRGKREENRRKLCSVRISHSRCHLVQENRSTRMFEISMSFQDKTESKDLLLFEDLATLFDESYL